MLALRPQAKVRPDCPRKAQGIAGFATHEQLQASHRGWLDSRDGSVIGSGPAASQWAARNLWRGQRLSLAFVLRGGRPLDSGEGYQLREPQASYSDISDTKIADIGSGNTYL